MQLFTSTSISTDWQVIQDNLSIHAWWADAQITYETVIERVLEKMQPNYKSTVFDELEAELIKERSVDDLSHYNRMITLKALERSIQTYNHRYHDPTFWDNYIHHYDR